MLKVNSEKLLQDYEELCEKRSTAIDKIKAAAQAFAETRGYDENQTNDFISYVIDVEECGLTENETEMLEFLSRYVEEEDDYAEADNGEAVNPY